VATHRIPILGWATLPDINGQAFPESYDTKATNDVWDRLVMVFNDSIIRSALAGGFAVPKNYVGTPKLIIVWTATATSGAVVWDFDYRAVGGNDAESLDQTGTQEAVTVTDTAPGAAHRRLEAEIALTAGNFAVDDEVEFLFARDGTDAADTMAAAALLFGLYFEYADA
jgi:hypothetical protein